MINRYLIFSGLSLASMPFVLHAEENRSDDMSIPNVLFIIADDLRPALGCYGDKYAQTPEIDKLASLSMVFDKAYCQQALSNPSRVAMLTGLRPDETGVDNLVKHFRKFCPDVITLPQMFRNNGYYTASCGKVFHVIKGIGDPVSWSVPEDPNVPREYFDTENLAYGGKKAASYEIADLPDSVYLEYKIADRGIAHMEKAVRDNVPFFVAVGFTKPHLPYCAPKKYWDLYENKNIEIASSEVPLYAPDIALLDSPELRGYKDIPDEGPINDSLKHNLKRAYYATVSLVDSQIGRILDAVETLGVKDNTIIVLWGDHGYHLGEFGQWGKFTCYEIATRVPLMVSVPGARHGRSDELVEVVDIYPTLSDLCGLVCPENLSGSSFEPILYGKPEKWKKNTAFSQIKRPYLTRSSDDVVTHVGYTLRTKKWRCVCWFDAKTGEITDTELYRLMKKNCLESINLAGKKEYRNVENKFVNILKNCSKGFLSDCHEK